MNARRYTTSRRGITDVTEILSRAEHVIRVPSGFRYPRAHVFMDTRPQVRQSRGVYEHTWAMGAVWFRRQPKGGKLEESMRTYLDVRELWEDVDRFACNKGRTVIWTHNLGYDIRVSEALVRLNALGWRVEGWAMATNCAWLRMTKQSYTVLFADSANIFPTTIAQLGKHFRRAEPPMSKGATRQDVEMSRCVANATVLRDAMVAYFEWVEANGLGGFAPSGSGQAMNAFVGRFMHHPILVHWCAPARLAERRAMWTGRCEAFWHGLHDRGATDEWDLSAAYPRIGHRFSVPVRFIKPITSWGMVERYLNDFDYEVLAEIEVTTEVPTLPGSRDGRILWPVGRFETTVWGPELRLAMERGARVDLRRAFLYEAQPALQGWGEWILSILDDRTGAVSDWIKLVAQHWARSLIGRFGMQYTEWEYLGESPRIRFHVAPAHYTEEERYGEVAQVGRSLFEAKELTEGAQTVPAITGWIMSKCREMMTRLWLALGDRKALYMDTDSLLVPRRFEGDVARAARDLGIEGLRIKKSFRSVEIMGPRKLIVDQRARVSGIPLTAQRLPDGRLRGEVHESLRGTLVNGRAARVRVTPRIWRLSKIDPRRLDGPDGWTQPVRLPA